MRPPSHQSVAAWLWLAALGLVLACGQVESSSSAIGASPLLQMDEDRLWILLWAREDMNPGCGKFYAQPDDPRYSGRRLNCEQWERSALEVLRANEVAGLEAGHLREAEFWRWYYAKGQAIARCSASALQAKDLPASKKLTASMSCDPHRRWTQVEKRNVDRSGFRIP